LAKGFNLPKGGRGQEIDVREHSTQVFLPQPEQLELEITHSNLTTKKMLHITPVYSYCAALTPPPSV